MTEATTTQAARATSPLRLLDAFREVYAEVARSERALGGPEPPLPEAVKQRLLNILSRQSADAKEHLGDHEIAELDEAQYVMVAMADEVLLQPSWPGREEWARRPLEAESRFGTHVAGERFFDRIREILSERLSVSSELLNVYLTALSLGFRGRYRFDPTSPEPDRFRRDLVREIRRIDARLAAPAAQICPEAVQAIRNNEPRRSLTGLHWGVAPLLAVIGGMLVLGQAFWYYRTSEVRDQLDLVEAQTDAWERLQKSAREAQASAPAAGASAAPADTSSPATPPAPDGGAP